MIPSGAPIRILVIGASGQLGRELMRAGRPAGVTVRGLTRAEVDLETPAAEQAVQSFRPDAVINAAAHTAVDQAESDPEPAWRLNRDVPARLAAATAAVGAAFIHISTDYVFDGAKGAPYVESDPVCPLNVYGKSKAAGEAAVLAASPRNMVVRTSWLYAAAGNNFVRTMLRLAAERDLVRVVDDQQGSPTAAADLAAALVRATLRAVTEPATPGGIYHYVGRGATTWHGFAVRIFSRLAALGLPHPATEAIPSSAYPVPARRPADSRLDCSRFAATFGLEPPPWEDSLDKVLNEILSGAESK
jgi:dTDP-4-dehydrorhamnose reductase